MGVTSSTVPREATRMLAEYAVSTTYVGLPSDVVERTKMVIFDELACMVLGRELEPGSVVLRYVFELGGRSASTVIGTSSRLPAPLAALANGTAGHADEFDGTHVNGGHPGPVVVPAALAVAEQQGSGGRDLINAVTLGYDVGTRVADAAGGAAHLAATARLQSDFLYAFGAAAAAARLLRLDAAGHRHAAALAAGQAIGLQAVFGEDSHVSKSLANGQAARAGVSGALMSKCGLTGNANVFETPGGVLDAWGLPERTCRLTAALGQHFGILGANFKFYSAGYPIHAPVEAALAVMRDERLEPGDVRAVVVHMPSPTANIVDKRSMPTINLPDMLAVAMVRRALGFEEAHGESVRSDPRITALAAKISIDRQGGVDEFPPYGRGASIDITTTTGAVHSRTVPFPRGHSHLATVEWADLDDKWRPLLPDRIGADRYVSFLRRCQNLEGARNVGSLVTGLQRGDRR